MEELKKLVKEEYSHVVAIARQFEDLMVFIKILFILQLTTMVSILFLLILILTKI